MKKYIEELSDEETYAIENGDEINEGNYSLTYDEHCANAIDDELYGILEYTGYLQYLGDRYAKAEKNLKTIENEIIGLIGKDAYLDIIDLFTLQQSWLKRDISLQFEEYNDLTCIIHAEDKRQK